MGLLVVDAVALLRQEEPVVAAVLEPLLVERQALERVHEEQPEVHLRYPPLVERRNWQAARLQQLDNAEVRLAPVADAVAVDEVAPLRLQLLRIPAI